MQIPARMVEDLLHLGSADAYPKGPSIIMVFT